MGFHPARRWLASGHRDRLTIGVETHRLISLKLQSDDGTWQDFALGGIGDVVLGAGYGTDHDLAKKFSLGWSLQGRYAWVFTTTQRAARIAARFAYRPARRHQLSLETTGYLIHRDDNQFGSTEFESLSLSGQADGVWQWMSRYGVGFELRGRLMSSVMNGEAPLYEVRSEVLHTPFAELLLGLQWIPNR